MKLPTAAALLLGVASAVSGQQQPNLRAAAPRKLQGQGQGQNQGQGRPMTESDSCVIEGIAALEIPGQAISGGDFDYECSDATDTGKPGKRLGLTKEQRAGLDDLVESGDIIFGETELDVTGAFLGDDGTVTLPNDQEPHVKKNGNNGNNGRSLLAHTGDRKVLAVRVIDVNGLAHPDSSVEMSYNIFGGGGDLVNFKSQIEDCSYGAFTASNDYSGFSQYGQIAPHIEAPGVISVNIPIDITTATSRYDVRNAVTTAVQAKLGFNLPGPFHSVWYNLQGCYNDCGWAAYAYINSWNSVYQSRYYREVGVQIHEIGHNLGLAHSGGLNGATYTDHTGLMGNPLYSDEVGKMCYNPAKNWQLAWYGGTGASGSSPHKVLVNPQTDPYTSINLVGVADYDYGNAINPIVVKIETGTATDLFVGFNRATGINNDNDEADNEVVITQAGSNGEGYSQSYLQAHLIQGEQHSVSNFAGTGQTLTITAETIDLTSSPGTATVTIALGCTGDEQCDDGLYCNGAETCGSNGQCQAGTPIACEDDGFFCNGNEVCDEASNSCISINPPCAPDDGNLCNGVESCDEINGVCSSSPPVDCSGQNGATCGGGMTCQPSTGQCIDTGAEDGICSSGENCNTCPNDCPSGTSGGASCGNGICETGNNESCSTCPQDCNGIQGGKPSNRYCCGSGTSCDDPRCTCNGNTCIATEVAAVNYCCGDLQCTGEETHDSCPIDCPAPAPTPFTTSAPTKAPTPPTGGPVNCPSGCNVFTAKNACNAEAGCSWVNGNPKYCDGAPDCLGGSATPEFCSGSGGFCSGDGDCCGASICKGNSRCS